MEARVKASKHILKSVSGNASLLSVSWTRSGPSKPNIMMYGRFGTRPAMFSWKIRWINRTVGTAAFVVFLTRAFEYSISDWRT